MREGVVVVTNHPLSNKIELTESELVALIGITSHTIRVPISFGDNRAWLHTDVAPAEVLDRLKELRA
jgi:hypothetical protein